jgi:hypothetical protein
MRRIASIVLCALLTGCPESGAMDATIDATVEDAPIDKAAPEVGDEPPRVFGPWPDVLRDAIRTDDVFSLAPMDVIQTPRCVPGTTARCVCDDLREGLQGCYPEGAWRACVCPPPVPPRTQPLPPRLIHPLSGLRVTSQRPTLRWVLPEGVTRARVEVCADRPCARVLERAEVSGTSWRPTARLSPGVVFWRVLGLNAGGAVAWTSATWEFGVRHSDAPVDTAYGSLKDYNGDGYDDMVAVQGLIPEPDSGAMGSGHPFIFNGSRTGIATEPSARLNEQLCGVRAVGPEREFFAIKLGTADFNGDGFADLAVSDGLGEDPCRLGETVLIYHGSARGLSGVSQRVVRPAGPEWRYFAPSFGVGDVNGDGFGDVLVVGLTFEYHEHKLLVYLGSPSGLAATPLLSAPWRWRNEGGGMYFYAVTSGDVDGDGYPDVIARASQDTVIFYGDAEGSLQRVATLASDEVTMMSNRIAVDVNADGLLDVVGGSPTTLWEAVGGSLVQTYQRFNPRSMYRGELVWYGEVGAPGDGNGDGTLEIVSRDFCLEESVAGCTTGVISLYERSGVVGGLGTPRDLRAARTLTRAAFVGDLNGDGADELVIADGPVVEVYSLVRGMTLQTRVANGGSVIRLE